MAASDHAYPSEGQRASSATELKKPQTVLGRSVGVDELNQHFIVASAYKNWLANLNARDIENAVPDRLMETAYCLFRDIHLTANCDTSGALVRAFEKMIARYKVHIDGPLISEERSKFIPADGAPIETAPEPESPPPASQPFQRVGMGRGPGITQEKEELAEAIFSAEAVTGHTSVTINRSKLTPPHFVQFANGIKGIVANPTSGVMVSSAFGRTYGEVRRDVMTKADLINRISTQLQNVAFAVGCHDSSKMEYLTLDLFSKFPDAPADLVLACLQVGSPQWQTMAQEELRNLLADFYELVGFLNPGMAKQIKETLNGV